MVLYNRPQGRRLSVGLTDISSPPVFGYEGEVRMGFYEFEGQRPKVVENAFVHP